MLHKYNAAGEELINEPGFAPQAVVCKAFLAMSTAALGPGFVKIPYNAKAFDPYGWFDTSLSRFTPKIAGYYEVSAISDTANPGGLYAMFLYKNGTQSGGYMAYGTASAELMMTGSTVIYMNGTTDYLEIFTSTAAAAIRYGSVANMENAVTFTLQAASVGVAPEPWHYIGAANEPGFNNGWVNYDSSQSFARFMKDPEGFVHLGGIIKAGTMTVASGAFILPPGYRPAVNLYMVNIANGAAGYLYVQPTGAVAPWGGSNAWWGLDGTVFRAEQ